ncbi:Gamma-glutamylcyclotransferase [Leucoagaricus sp. SymC.cos]|nr:Gamma-glutamylcyclotransferase [Leucoagaricus sp. SymC.cos]
MVETQPSPRLYLGYGSNMWIEQMVRRCPQSKCLGIGFLLDWKWFICERGYANIIESKGDKVYGLVYEVSESDEKNLDHYENVPTSYVKKILTVIFLGKTDSIISSAKEMLVYVDVERVHYGPPKTEYIYRMNMAIADAIKEGVPEEYVQKTLRPFIPKQWASSSQPNPSTK